MAEELYESPREQISQGDILEILPHVYLEGPLVALKSETETIFTASREPHLEFDDKKGQWIVATCKRTKAVLISNDCEIDKPQAKRWLVCPVVPLVTLKPKTREHVKRNRIYSMLHLPKHGNILEDSFINFNQITTIDAGFVKAASRVSSLSDVGRRALYHQFIRWLTRWELREHECPGCGIAFNPADVLPVRFT